MDCLPFGFSRPSMDLYDYEHENKDGPYGHYVFVYGDEDSDYMYEDKEYYDEYCYCFLLRTYDFHPEARG